MTRQATWLFPAVTLFALLGCDCGKPVDERQLVVSFTSPLAGAQLTDADDVDRTLSGLQADVEVKLEWESIADGERFPADIEEAALSFRKNVAGDDFTDAVSGIVAPGGLATFPPLTFLSNGEYQLRAVVKELSTQQTTDPLKILINVQSIPNRPQLLTAELAEDLNQDLKVTLAELPVGEQLHLRLTAINFPSGTVTVTNALGVAVAENVAVADGTAPFEIPLNLPQDPTTATEAEYTLTVLLKDGARQSEPGANPPDTLKVVVDQLPPTVELLEPLDKDGGYGTVPLTAVANVQGAPGATVAFASVLAANGNSMDAGTSLVGPDGVATATLSLFEGRQTLTARVTDSAGNPAEDSKTFTVNTLSCSVAITDPAADNTYLGPSQDASADAGFQYNVRGTSEDCFNRAVRITVGAALFTGQTDGAGAFTVSVELQPGANTLSANIDNGTGVFGNADVRDVFVSATDFRITQPLNNTVMGRLFDTNSAIAGIQSVLTWSGTLPVNGFVDICADLPAGTGTTDCPDGSGWILLGSNVPPNTNSFDYPDGAYSLKAMMRSAVGSGTTTLGASAPVSIRVDSVRPAVAANGFVLVNDANADLRLNATEQPSGLPRAIINTGEPGTTVVVRSRATNVNVSAAGVTGAANTVELELTSLTSSEADYELEVVVTDSAGNTNNLGVGTTADPRNESALVTVRIDRVAPTCDLSQPTKSNLGPADDANPTAAGFQIRTDCVSQADIGTVSFRANSDPAVAGMISGTVASAELTVPASGTTQYTLSATPTDLSGNVGLAATKVVTVDFDPPTMTINSPTNAGGPYTEYTIATQVTVGGAEGGTVFIFSSASPTPADPIGTLTVVSGVASGNVTYPNGSQTITAKVSDLAGNEATRTESILVASTGCSITLSAPAPTKLFLNKADDENAATPSLLEYTVTGTSSNCADRPFSVYSGSGSARSLLASGLTSATGAFSALITLAEGAQHLEIELTDAGNVVRFVSHDATVDLQAPVLSNVTPAGANLTYVSPTNVNLRGTPVPGFIEDANPAAADAQVSYAFRATGALGGKATILYQGTPLGVPTDITADPQDLTAAVTLAQATSGQVELRIQDQAGNPTAETKSVVVDVVAPAAPGFSLAATDLRFAKVSVSWPSVFDDGSDSGSGAVTGYDLRWTTDVLAPTGISTEDLFFDGAKVRQETGAFLPASTLSHQLSLPPLAVYSVSVRAVDEVGNYSAFIPGTSLSNQWNKAELANPGPSTSLGFHIAGGGDLNGDGLNDFAAGAPGGTAPGQVQVYLGNSAAGAIVPQGIGPSDGSTGTQGFGFSLDIGNVSHPAPSALSDLAVSSPAYLGIGRVYLYFGKASASFDGSASNAVIIEGTTTSVIGRSVAMIGDITGDSRSELMISAHTENANRGRVYIFFSRDRAAWDALRVNGVIPISSADRMIEGPFPVGSSTLGNNFTWQRGMVNLGLVNGDSAAEFAVAASVDNVNKVYVFSGASVFARTAASGIPTLTTGEAPTADDSLQMLTTTDPGAGSTREGFGSRMAGNANLIGTAANDFVIAYPFRSRVHLFEGSTTAPFTATSTVFTGSPGLGSAVAAGDINGDAKADLVIGDTVVSANSAWFFFNGINNGPTGAAFDTQAGVGFQHSRLSSTSALGRAAVLVDFNGDGKLDIVLGDTTTNKVTLLWL